MIDHEGIGDMKELVAQFKLLGESLDNVTVIQPVTISGVASLTFKANEVELQMGTS